MSVAFRAVQWNRAKLVYDAILLAAIMLFIAGFIGIGGWIEQPKNEPEWIGLRIRTFGSCAFLMLTIILAIGPLARLDRRFLPLLYNRRHFGVLTFFVAALHAWFMVEWYIAQGLLGTLMPELMNVSDYGKFIGFPFKVLGIAALIVLFLMAATSHDYWLVFLTPLVWKALHTAWKTAARRRRSPRSSPPTACASGTESSRSTRVRFRPERRRRSRWRRRVARAPDEAMDVGTAPRASCLRTVLRCNSRGQRRARSCQLPSRVRRRCSPYDASSRSSSANSRSNSSACFIARARSLSGSLRFL
jgi:DMSO/TMAO reductase YedYZ heme-binding membrane subunit